MKKLGTGFGSGGFENDEGDNIHKDKGAGGKGNEEDSRRLKVNKKVLLFFSIGLLLFLLLVSYLSR